MSQGVNNPVTYVYFIQNQRRTPMLRKKEGGGQLLSQSGLEHTRVFIAPMPISEMRANE